MPLEPHPAAVALGVLHPSCTLSVQQHRLDTASAKAFQSPPFEALLPGGSECDKPRTGLQPNSASSKYICRGNLLIGLSVMHMVVHPAADVQACCVHVAVFRCCKRAWIFDSAHRNMLVSSSWVRACHIVMEQHILTAAGVGCSWLHVKQSLV